MNDPNAPLGASLLATCLFGAAALLGLLLAGLWVGSGAAALLALIALGASYLAQSLFTFVEAGAIDAPRGTRIGLAFQGVAVAAWLVGVFCLLPALWG